MKLVLSRKGVDSAAGRAASPIFPDGRMLSLPIPDRSAAVAYAEIAGLDGEPLGDIVAALTRGRLPPNCRAHLDPDLRPGALPRQPGWRPLFGQVGAAQGHLAGRGVGPGDLFLFFGRFREVERREGGHGYARGSRPRHVLFGWLRVGEVHATTDLPERLPGWAGRHPHVARPRGGNDTLYVAAERLGLGVAGRSSAPGGGVFPCFHPDLELTAPGSRRSSLWRLPGWLHPEGRRSALSYHLRPDAWARDPEGHALLRAVARGQELVLDCDDYPEAAEWAGGLVDRMRG